MKALILENSKVVTSIIRRLFESEKFEVFEASSFKEANARFALEVFDVITLSLYLEEDGFEICSKIRKAKTEEAFYNSKNADIIFITSKDTIESRLKGFAAGATEFVIKKNLEEGLQPIISNLINPKGNLENSNILIIDDSEINRLIVKQLLKNSGAKLIEAGNGKQGLDLVQSHNNTIDMILTDYYMPEMNGTDLCIEIRKIYSLKHLPVIILTGANDKSEVLSIFQAGATDYLVKPFIKEELLARIENHLEAWLYRKNILSKINKL